MNASREPRKETETAWSAVQASTADQHLAADVVTQRDPKQVGGADSVGGAGPAERDALLGLLSQLKVS